MRVNESIPLVVNSRGTKKKNKKSSTSISLSTSQTEVVHNIYSQTHRAELPLSI